MSDEGESGTQGHGERNVPREAGNGGRSEYQKELAA